MLQLWGSRRRSRVFHRDYLSLETYLMYRLPNLLTDPKARVAGSCFQRKQPDYERSYFCSTANGNVLAAYSGCKWGLVRPGAKAGLHSIGWTLSTGTRPNASRRKCSSCRSFPCDMNCWSSQNSIEHQLWEVDEPEEDLIHSQQLPNRRRELRVPKPSWNSLTEKAFFWCWFARPVPELNSRGTTRSRSDLRFMPVPPLFVSADETSLAPFIWTGLYPANSYQKALLCRVVCTEGKRRQHGSNWC